MKLRHFLIIMLLCTLLCGCHREAEPAPTQSAPRHPELSAFEEVLSGTLPISPADGSDPILVSQIHLFFTTEDVSWGVVQIAVLDLDGDGVLEAVLEVENYIGYVILDYQEDTVTGTGIWYRAFQDLKADGSYAASGGSFNRCYLQYRYPEEVLLAECYETINGEPYYSIGGEETDEETFSAFEDAQLRKENARWHPSWEDYLQTLPSE